MKTLVFLLFFVPVLAHADVAPEVTPENWYWGPENQWSYQNTRRVFPSANVQRGSDPVSELERAPRDLDNLSFIDPITDLTMSISDMYEATHTNGFLVLHQGKIVTERYFNGMDPDEPHLLMSVSKSVVGALVGIIVEQGKLNLEAEIVSYVPEMRGTAYQGATVRHLLDMSVGLNFNEDYSSKTSDLYRLDEAVGWVPKGPNPPRGLHDYLKSLVNTRGSHGEAFLYASPNTDLMSWILERATKTDFAELISRELWSKLGAEQDAYVLLDGYQNAYADPGLNATLRDLGRFGQMMAQNGRFNGTQIVPEAWVTDIRENGDKAAWKRSPAYEKFDKFEGYQNGSYRSYWYVTGDTFSTFAGIGLGGQFLAVDPDSGVVIVKFSAFPSPTTDYTATHHAAALAIIKTLSLTE